MKINVSIDDVSSHPQASTKVLDRCFELLEDFPDIKFSLFIPIAYWRTLSQSTPEPLWIHKDEKFIKELKKLPEESFELCYHGLFHGIPGKSNNDEFKDIDTISAEDKMWKMLSITEAILNNELPFKKIFRPPAWRMSPDAIKVFTEEDFILALAPFDYVMRGYMGSQRNSKVVYCSSCPPDPILHVTEKNEIVYHACEWDRNYLSIQYKEQLKNFLNQNECEFVFIDGLL